MSEDIEAARESFDGVLRTVLRGNQLPDDDDTVDMLRDRLRLHAAANPGTTLNLDAHAKEMKANAS